MNSVQEAMEKANRLVIDSTSMDARDYDGVDMSELVVPLQNLPCDIHEWLRIDFVIAPGVTASWLVGRIDTTKYYFIYPQEMTGGGFNLGNFHEKAGWHHPKKPYTWMGHETASGIAIALMWFFDQVEKRQQFPFIVTSEKDPNKVKNPSKRKKLKEQNNVVVYLGRPPGTPPKKKPDDEVTPREFGYPRRQHRRTLRSERFKNHPKYGVYKGVLVKQSWCGPKEYIHKRKVYRLWEPPEIDTTS